MAIQQALARTSSEQCRGSPLPQHRSGWNSRSMPIAPLSTVRVMHANKPDDAAQPWSMHLCLGRHSLDSHFHQSRSSKQSDTQGHKNRRPRYLGHNPVHTRQLEALRDDKEITRQPMLMVAWNVPVTFTKCVAGRLEMVCPPWHWSSMAPARTPNHVRTPCLFLLPSRPTKARPGVHNGPACNTV